MKKILLVVLVAVIVAVVFAQYKPAKVWMSEIDYVYLGGIVSSAIGEDVGSLDSDQRLYQAVIAKADFSWLSDETIWIAHSLGLGGEYANTPTAFYAGLEAGFNIFEVDIIFRDGELHCAHDDKDVEFKTVSGCSFDWLMETAEKENVWIVLDVKSKFRPAYAEISRRLSNSVAAKQFIPQIYTFNQIKFIDLELFAGPIFTGYKINQGEKLLRETAIKLGLPAITLPPSRLAESFGAQEVRVFSHGINTKKTYARLKANGVTGFYIRTPLYKEIHATASLVEHESI